MSKGENQSFESSWNPSISAYSIMEMGIKQYEFYCGLTKYISKVWFCWHPKLARLRFSRQFGQTGQTSHINRSDRSRQVYQIANWTTPLHRFRRGDLNAYIEHPIWTLDEKVMPPERPAPRSETGQRRPDQFGNRSDRSKTPNSS